MSALELVAGQYYWYRSPKLGVILLRVVASPPGRLLAGPWTGGMQWVDEMQGEWLSLVEPPS